MQQWWLFIVIGICLIAALFVIYNYFKIKRMDEGTDRMVKMSGIIREGANVFILKEFKTIGIVVAALAILFSLFIESFSGLTYLLGAAMSSVVCIVGMKSATYANVRTANKARTSLSIGETVKVALSGGSISGLAVQACGLLGIVLIVLLSGVGTSDQAISTLTGIKLFNGCGIVKIDALLTNTSVMRITTYALGCYENYYLCTRLLNCSNV